MTPALRIMLGVLVGAALGFLSHRLVDSRSDS